MLQLGFVSAILPELSLEEVFQTAADIGFDCVEVMCWPVGKSTRRYAGITHIDVDQLDGESVAHIKELSDRYQVSVSGLGYYPNPLTPDSSERQNKHRSYQEGHHRVFGFGAGKHEHLHRARLATQRRRQLAGLLGGLEADHRTRRSQSSSCGNRELPDVVHRRRMARRKESRP